MADETATTKPMEEEPRIVEIDEEQEKEEEKIEETEEMPSVPTPDEPRKPSRAEKKVRKAMEKLGMTPVGGVTRVTVKKSKQGTIVISRPEVFRSPASDTYVVFGEPRLEDPSAQAQQQAAQQFREKAEDDETKPTEPIATPAGIEEIEDKGEEEEIDETGLEASDIELVMAQAATSRAKAVKALRKEDGDIVKAIMSLSDE
eukprot:TRINITY_DN80526_c0_g1_i1.p1 TRINITY_DN80526_c0_g1~~TRINITY_DN80526_c0_g1_i1.p1  ORF type:complete len:202 (-),score=86.98 TRINITY_DN80526_c0_g1_i1:89-694(-)